LKGEQNALKNSLELIRPMRTVGRGFNGVQQINVRGRTENGVGCYEEQLA
jgi:hypothetical protein